MTRAATCNVDSAGSEHVMQCMEVWGGNQCVDRRLTMAGLDAWLYSRPYGEATGGGDVHYVSSCATGRITRLLVADVTGHGSSVHELATGLRTLMRKFVNYIDQTRFVGAMNEQFAAMSVNGNFATAVVTTFFAPTSRLRICNAGHPPPLLYRTATQAWSYLELAGGGDERTSPSNLPLGVIDLADYEQFEVGLSAGDLVLCYTDSLCESHDAEGRMLCQEGLLRVVSDLPVGDPATFVARLLDRVAALHPGNLTNDDVTALLFRPTGGARTTPFLTGLMAPFRVLREVVKSVVRRSEPAPWPEMSVPSIGGVMIDPLNRVGQGSAAVGDGAKQVSPGGVRT